MFLKVEVKKGTDEEAFAAELRKKKEVVGVTVSKPRKKKKEPMTDYYSKGKQLSLKEFKARIKAAEEDIKAGRFYTMDEMWQKHEAWKKKKGLK